MRTTITALLLITSIAATAQAEPVVPLNHRDSLLVQQGAREACQRLTDHLELIHETTMKNQKRAQTAGDYALAAGYQWLDMGTAYVQEWIHDEFHIWPVAPTIHR